MEMDVSAKGCRGYGEPERQAVGCDPEKIFSQIFQNVNIHKISDLHKTQVNNEPANVAYSQNLHRITH